MGIDRFVHPSFEDDAESRKHENEEQEGVVYEMLRRNDAVMWDLRIQNLRTLYSLTVLERDRATDVLRELVRVHSLGEHCSEGDVRTAWSAARDLLAEGVKP